MWLCTPAGHAMWAQGVYGVGPQGAFLAKYGSLATAEEQTLARIKSWGFNFLHTAADENELPWNRTTKLPAVVIARPGLYGMSATGNPNNPLPAGTITQNIKDLENGHSPFFTNISQLGTPDWADTTRLSTVLNYILVLNTGGDPGGIPGAIAANNSLDYLIGIAVEDSDQTWGYWNSGQNDPFDTQPSGLGSAHGGYLTAIMSPQQQADALHLSLYDTDQVVYSKKAWHDLLVAKYGTVGALNTAWGSSYTTFGSSSSAVSGESFGTTDGTHFSFTHTLSSAGTLSPDSIQVLEDGTMIAGDCFHPNWGDACNPTNGTTIGGVYGPTATGGTVTYASKSVTLSFSKAFEVLDSLSCSTSGTPSCTAHIVDYEDAAFGATVGSKITVTGSVCCSTNVETVTAKTGPSGSPSLFTYTWTNVAGNTGSETFTGGARDFAAVVTVPTAGHALTVNYQVNGWDSGGTGLMDEDGRSAHTWLGTDPYALSNANANTATDLRAFLGSLGATYFASMRSGVRAAFTGASLVPPMYLGPDAFGTWTSTPRQEVLTAASGVIDMAIMGGAAGFTLTQPMLDFMAQYYGGPFLDGIFLHANQDSAEAATILGNDYATQPLRAAGYYADMQSYLTSTTSSNFTPRVGFGWWQYSDNSSESTNWGLVTLTDNAYNAHDAATGLVACAAPLGAFTCGSEPAPGGSAIRPFGDLLGGTSGVIAANSLWIPLFTPSGVGVSGSGTVVGSGFIK